MITINATRERSILRIGKSLENGVTSVRFDIRKWVKALGVGTAVVLHQRANDTEAYPVSSTMSNGIVTWVVSSADTAYAGYGRCELQYIVDDALVKSKIWKTLTLESLEEGTEAPDPESGWVADLLEKVQEMVDGIDGQCGCDLTVASDDETTEMLSGVFS